LGVVKTHFDCPKVCTQQILQQRNLTNKAIFILQTVLFFLFAWATLALAMNQSARSSSFNTPQQLVLPRFASGSSATEELQEELTFLLDNVIKHAERFNKKSPNMALSIRLVPMTPPRVSMENTDAAAVQDHLQCIQLLLELEERETLSSAAAMRSSRSPERSFLELLRHNESLASQVGCSLSLFLLRLLPFSLISC
jgi:hypothetical protein